MKKKCTFSILATTIIVFVVLSAALYGTYRLLFAPVEKTISDSLPSVHISDMKAASDAAVKEASDKEDALAKKNEISWGNAVSENPVPAEETWFDDSIFIGDSLTYGLAAYHMIDSKSVVASTSINPQSILKKECIEQSDGNKVTVLQAMSSRNPKRIYIMLGSNGVSFLSKDKLIEFYAQFVDSIKKQHPNSIIYLESILPITKAKESAENCSNAKIDEYNAAIMKMAGDKQVYYLNVAEAIKDETGCLPKEISGDGMHFGPSTYNIWLDYVLRHYVET